MGCIGRGKLVKEEITTGEWIRTVYGPLSRWGWRSELYWLVCLQENKMKIIPDSIIKNVWKVTCFWKRGEFSWVSVKGWEVRVKNGVQPSVNGFTLLYPLPSSWSKLTSHMLFPEAQQVYDKVTIYFHAVITVIEVVIKAKNSTVIWGYLRSLSLDSCTEGRTAIDVFHLRFADNTIWCFDPQAHQLCYLLDIFLSR